jgi:hypothetical protein
MSTASLLDVPRLLQSRDRGEKAVLGEHIHPVHRESCALVPHPVGREIPGFAAPTTATQRAS